MADGGERSPGEEWVVETLARQRAAIHDLESRVVDARGWLGVERHANSLLRHLATWSGGRRAESVLAEVMGDRGELEAARERAIKELDGFERRRSTRPAAAISEAGSPLDACPDSPTIAAIAQLAELFVDQEVRT